MVSDLGWVIEAGRCSMFLDVGGDNNIPSLAVCLPLFICTK